MSSSSFRPDGEPTVTATLAAEDGTYEVSPRYGSVHLKALSMEAQEVLTKFDRNGDGEVDETELENVIDVLVKEQFKGRLFLCGILMLCFSLVLLLASSFGLTWAVVLAHKDMVVRESVLVYPGTLEPVQVADLVMTLTSAGALAVRKGRAIKTAPIYEPRPLNANMTLKALHALKRVSITGRYGTQVGFRVTGLAVYSQGSPAVPSLQISTPTGTLVVQGDELASYDAVSGLVDPEEFRGQGVTGVFRM